MVRTLGNSTALGSVTAGPPTPPAIRATRPGWRDPRLWVGIAIVAGCVVAGARVVGSADETVAVWAVRTDEGAGAILSRADLAVHRVKFASSADLAGYYRADTALPSQLTLVRGVGSGELLPRTAVGSGTTSGTVQVPLAVDPAQVPPAVRTGSVVDVYVLAAAEDDRAPATPALSAVTVVAAPRTGDVFGAGQTKRQLTLAVPEKQAQAFFGLMATGAEPAVTVVLRPPR